MDALTKYLKAFKKLHVDRSHGIAPHKPILLLSVLQSFHSNAIQNNRIYITPELVALFKTNWNLLVRTKHDCKMSYPFYYLKSDKFWSLVPKAGFENISQMGSVMNSFSSLNAAVEYAKIDDELFRLMSDKRSNEILQQLLLEEFFNETKSNVSKVTYEQKQLFDDLEGRILKEGSVEYRNEIKELLQHDDEEGIFLRGSVFKREVPKIYNYTCCISGMKIDAAISISMVDACHIVPFSESHDDTITNGIALCPNLHRAFDRGLIAIDDDYRVIVSKLFKEEDVSYSIKAFDKQKINLPLKSNYYPLRNNFAWHREKILKN